MTPRDNGDRDDLRDASRGVRLQKALAEAGVASRRRCEELVAEGKVRVNGRVVTELPAWVDPEKDQIEVGGRPLRPPARPVYVMLYKPKGYVSTLEDPEGRPTIGELVKHPSGTRLFPVGRLEFDALGLLLMTNDGELANRLTHPRFGVERVYLATVKGFVKEESLPEIERALSAAGSRAPGKGPASRRKPPVRVEIFKREPARTALTLRLTGASAADIEERLDRAGHRVKKLVRVAVGPVQLKRLRVGEWRDLDLAEVQRLKRTAFAGEPAKAAKKKPKRKPRKGSVRA